MRKSITVICIVFLLCLVSSQGFSLTPQPPKSQKVEKFAGRVTSVNHEDSTIVVQSIKAGMTFDVKSAKLKGYKTVTGIKENDRVTVQYVMHEGKATARTLTKNKSYR